MLAVISRPEADRRSLCSSNELNLEHTLASGQVFRWSRNDDGSWSAPIGPDCRLITCSQNEDGIVIHDPDPDSVNLVRAYFQLDIDLPSISQSWTQAYGPEMESALHSFPGLRVCRQDSVECLFSFLCSSAAPVYRIKRMLDNVCRELGEKILSTDGQTVHAFPTLERLAETSRTDYDRMGLGYRGGNTRLVAAELIARGGRRYVESLADSSYADAKFALVSLPGIGAKIADCVCLFSLGKHDAVPLDTHMLRIARRHIARDLTDKTLTPALYNEISNRFRDTFGSHAGWAQQYLFTAELHSTGAWDSEGGAHRPGKKRALAAGQPPRLGAG